MSSSFQELSGLSFSLGAAGQQYLADTPWANPNHPSHQIQRQPSLQQEPRVASPAPGGRNRRHSHQPGGLFSSSTNSTIVMGNAVNGDSPLPKLQLAAGQEDALSPKVAAEPPPPQPPKREAVAQFS